MIHKTITIISVAALFALSACSQDTPEVTEKLRKVGSAIEGVWHVTDSKACEAGKQNATITITKETIEVHTQATDEKELLLKEMTKTNSNRYLILSGVQGKERNFKSFAYSDKGDKLEFAGFFIKDKLLTRKKILENYNADGKALENLKRYDYLFCGSA